MTPLSDILTSLTAYLRRYVVLTDEQAAIIATWVAVTHAISAFDCVGYLLITSATKRSGKTRLLECLEPVVHNPWLTGRTSTAALVRKLDAEPCTFLCDELDANFGGSTEFSETLRGVLNTGYRRSGKTTLCVPHANTYLAADFSTFGPKALAGIGDQPETVTDRSYPILLKRRTPDETVARFRARDVHRETRPLHDALTTWAAQEEVIEQLRAARPVLPDSLNDRAQDICEPLLAVAEEAGPPWMTRTRDAVIRIFSDTHQATEIHVTLLHDIGTVLRTHTDAFIGSSDLCDRLAAMTDRPWADWRRGNPITPRAVADRLRLFDIFPRSNGTARGYEKEQFRDAWSRYPAAEVSKRQTINESGPETQKQKRQPDGSVDTS
jgi:hypothetical protein